MFSPAAIEELLKNMEDKENFERVQREATDEAANPESPNHLKAMLELGIYKVYTTTIDAGMDTEIIDGFAKICEVALLGKAHTANAYDVMNFPDLPTADVPEISPKLVLIFNHYNQMLGETNNPKIQTILGICYEKGIGTPRNLQKAKLYYGLAVNQDYAPAYYNLSSYMDKDSEEQIAYFKAAANQEYAPAQNEVGFYYQYILNNQETASEFYALAAAQGYAPAQNNLAFYFESIEENLERVMPLYYLAADQGYQEAQNNLDRYWADVNANVSINTNDGSESQFTPQYIRKNPYKPNAGPIVIIEQPHVDPTAIIEQKKNSGCCAIL